jgi:hypothetical protein
MRALRVVGITEVGGQMSVVLEDPDRRERFTVPADEQLRAAARGDLTRLGQIAIEVESQLRPREIQARIRAGASVEQVANAAGVPLQKIERFAYPVLLERSRTAEVAQRAHPVRADGPDSRMLGDVVAHTFGLRGQEYVDVDWDSWKGEDGKWVVALSWHAGHSDNRAHWTFQPGANGGTVTAVDENASDLVEGLLARPLRTVGPVIDMTRPDEAGPAQGPLPELRAAASDTARRGPDYPALDRTSTRVAPEPRRPAPRQTEPQQAPASAHPDEWRRYGAPAERYDPLPADDYPTGSDATPGDGSTGQQRRPTPDAGAERAAAEKAAADKAAADKAAAEREAAEKAAAEKAAAREGSGRADRGGGGSG